MRPFTEDIARDLFGSSSGLSVRAEELAENIVVQFLVFALGQCTPQAFVVGFNGFHCCDDGFGAVLAVGQSDEVIELNRRQYCHLLSLAVGHWVLTRVLGLVARWAGGRWPLFWEKSSLVSARFFVPDRGWADWSIQCRP